MAHSPLGASAHLRWENCPGSVREIAKLPEELRNYESEFAKEGTAMHEASALALNAGLDMSELVGRTFNGIEITGELADFCQEYVDAVRFAHELHGGELLVERSIEASALHKDAYGTLDAAVLSAPVACIFDLKGGEGIVVEAEDNGQFRQYAWMLLHDKPEFTDIVLTVVQPRREHSEGFLRSETLTRAELEHWANTKMLPAMRATESENAPLKAGEWCRFCPVNKALACPKTEQAFGFMSNEPPKFEVLSDAALLDQLKLVKAAKFYIAALEGERLKRMMAGAKLPGWLLVPKRADRIFRQTVEVNGAPCGIEEAASRWFGKEAFTEPALKSPAQLEKIKHPEAKAFVARYAYKPENGLTVAEDDGKTVGVEPPKPEAVFAGVKL